MFISDQFQTRTCEGCRFRVGDECRKNPPTDSRTSSEIDGNGPTSRAVYPVVRVGASAMPGAEDWYLTGCSHWLPPIDRMVEQEEA